MCARVCVCGCAHVCVGDGVLRGASRISVCICLDQPSLPQPHPLLSTLLSLFSLPLLSRCRVRTRGQRKARRGWTATLGNREGGTGTSEVDGSDAVQRGSRGTMPGVDSGACPAVSEPCPALREPDASPQSPPTPNLSLQKDAAAALMRSGLISCFALRRSSSDAAQGMQGTGCTPRASPQS